MQLSGWQNLRNRNFLQFHVRGARCAATGTVGSGTSTETATSGSICCARGGAVEVIQMEWVGCVTGQIGVTHTMLAHGLNIFETVQKGADLQNAAPRGRSVERHALQSRQQNAEPAIGQEEKHFVRCAQVEFERVAAFDAHEAIGAGGFGRCARHHCALLIDLDPDASRTALRCRGDERAAITAANIQ